MPNLPTDNLYKFTAIVGVVVLLVSVYFPIIKSRELKLAMIEIENQTKILRIETEYLEYITKNIKSAKEDRKIEKEDIVSKSFIIKSKLQEILSKTKQLDILEEDYYIIIKLQKICMLIGLILSISGFILWYFKIQKYLDRQLKKQS